MILGLDIGGANLKAATSDGRAAATAFPLWKSPERLPDALRTLAAPLSGAERFAVTMTGELADCFATKAEGVSRILAAVRQFAGEKPVQVWTTRGQFVDSAAAHESWRDVAAANWHALATWAGHLAPRGDGLLIDIGSTTTDLIPLQDGVPIPTGRTDIDRLLSSELVYTGVRRTPICAVIRNVNLRGQNCPLAAELFATMLDVHLLMGELPPDETDCETADGRPATVFHAENRLAHMFCCDRTELTSEELRLIARDIAAVQRRQIRDAVANVMERNCCGEDAATVILSGSGSSLARSVLAESGLARGFEFVELAARLSPALSESACAYAVARLAEEDHASAKRR
jgi:probable H4MPT-linked C1 transfer pathway protein